MSIFSHRDCTGSRMLNMINSTEEQKEEKIVAQIKEAPAATAIPATPSPDPITEAKRPLRLYLVHLLFQLGMRLHLNLAQLGLVRVAVVLRLLFLVVLLQRLSLACRNKNN